MGRRGIIYSSLTPNSVAIAILLKLLNFNRNKLNRA
jgi:hypothetical protein